MCLKRSEDNVRTMAFTDTFLVRQPVVSHAAFLHHFVVYAGVVISEPFSPCCCCSALSSRVRWWCALV